MSLSEINFTPYQKQLLKQTTLAWFAAIFLIRLIHVFISIPFVKENSSLITATILLYIPIIIFLKKKERIDYLDESLLDFYQSIKCFLVLALIIFPPLLILNHFYQRMLGVSYQPNSFPNFIGDTLSQVLVIALPEEFFFRGYVQGRLNQIFGKPWELFKVPIGPGLFLCSLIFAISHSLIHYRWWHLFIFFPALAFGWLREKRGTITPSILFHALCNIFSQWVALHYFLMNHP